MAYRWRNALLCYAEQSGEGTEASITPSTHGLRVGNVSLDFNQSQDELDEASGSLDKSAPVPSGMSCSISFELVMRGNTTPGSNLVWKNLLKPCGKSVVETGTAVPASPEALAAGGSTTTAVLGASAAATAQIYRGMPIEFTGAVPGWSGILDYSPNGSSKVATLTDTLGGALVATSNYQIPTNTLFKFGSTGIPFGTLHFYVDGAKFRVMDAQGNADIRLVTGQAGRLVIRMNGIFAGWADEAVPSVDFSGLLVPPTFRAGVLKLQRLPIATSRIEFTMNNELVNPEDANQQEGFAGTIITERAPRLSMDPLMRSKATADFIAGMRTGTVYNGVARWGSVAGNRFQVLFPQGQVIEYGLGNRNGLVSNEKTLALANDNAAWFLSVY